MPDPYEELHQPTFHRIERDPAVEIWEEISSDDDLPGGWSRSDFIGGDPDERSYAERGWDLAITNSTESLGGCGCLSDLAPLLEQVEDDIRQIARFEWRTPVTITLEGRHVSLETIELATGMPMIPLCDRRIPAEGVE